MAERYQEIHTRIEEAAAFVTSQYLVVEHALEGEERVSGDARTFLLFERTYLRGLADMVIHLRRGGTTVDLAASATKERMGYLTGRIETGVLHIHTVGLDVDGAGEIVPGNQGR